MLLALVSIYNHNRPNYLRLLKNCNKGGQIEYEEMGLEEDGMKLVAHVCSRRAAELNRDDKSRV